MARVTLSKQLEELALRLGSVEAEFSTLAEQCKTAVAGAAGSPMPPGELVPTATNFYIHTTNVSTFIVFTDTEMAIDPMNPTDYRLGFKIVPTSRIAMAPQLAKELANKLNVALDAYEKSYGPIPALVAKPPQV